MNVPLDTQSPAELFGAAATILSGEAAAQGLPLGLLVRLDYLDGNADAEPHRVALLRAAATFKRIFSLRAEDAPGLVALGAEVDAGCLGVPNAPLAGVSGTGLSFRQAFESCVGEAAEYVSQFATPEDSLMSLAAEDALADSTPALRALWQRLQPYRRSPGAARTDWAVAARMADGSSVMLPADLCLRRPSEVREIDPPWPLSTGCGAGIDPLHATLHGLLELVERDAVAMWLRGGMRPRAIPPGPGAVLLGLLRGDTARRRSWLLDITTDVGVPVVVAAACNDDGFGLCRGFACRPTLAEAADAALMELAQMELAYRLSAAKRDVRREAALNETDRQHIRVYTQVAVAATPALHPVAPPRPSCDLLSRDKFLVLAGVRARLATASVEAYAMNLTRSALGIAVSRTIAPDLEMSLTSPPGQRLRSAADKTGVDPTVTIEL